MPTPCDPRAYALSILTVVYAFNFIDRQILGILAPFIAADLGFDDARIGDLTGFYFALFYTTLALPLAFIADRTNRVRVVAISLAVWSGFTMVSGFVTSFFWLALARIGVAIGEAGGTPPSHAMISDLYPAKARGRAMAVYSLGIPFGIMAAYFCAAAVATADDVDWRRLFFLIGAPGVILAIVLALTVRDPARGQADLSQSATAGAEPAGADRRATLGQLLKIPSYWLMCLGISFASFGGYAISAFIVTYLVRAFPAVPVPTLLIILGVINGTAYAGGVYLGGWLADRGAQRSPAAYAQVAALGTLLVVPALFLALFSGQFALAMAGFAAVVFFGGFYLGPSFSVAQSLAPAHARAMASAIFFFVLNLVALGGGPKFVGEVSAALTRSSGDATMSIRLALASLVIPFVLALIFFLIAGRTLPADWRRRVMPA